MVQAYGWYEVITKEESTILFSLQRSFLLEISSECKTKIDTDPLNTIIGIPKILTILTYEYIK